MVKRIPFALVLIPLLFACWGEAEQGAQSRQEATAVPDTVKVKQVIPTRRGLAQWKDGVGAKEIDAAKSPRRVHVTVRTERGVTTTVSGKEFDTQGRQQRFRPEDGLKFWEDPARPGMVFIQVGGKMLGMRRDLDPGCSECVLPEGGLERIHVDALNPSGKQVVVIGYFQQIASDAALDAQTVKCKRCPPDLVCSVEPACD